MRLDPSSIDPRETYKLMIGLVVPRPIAWVGTVSAAGRRNLAPFSYFMGVTAVPPTVCFSVVDRQGEKKDTLRNLEEVPEFTLNVVSEAVGERMNVTSGDYAYGTDEFVEAGLTALPGEIVKAPRVAECAVTMEGRVQQIVRVGRHPSMAGLVIGEIVLFHVDDAVISPGGRIDADKLAAIGRMAGDTYSRTRDRFDMKRPVIKP